MPTDTFNRQRHAADLAQRECNGDPETFRKLYREKCERLGVDAHATGFDRHGSNARRLFANVMTTLKRHDPALADEFAEFIGAAQSGAKMPDDRDELSRERQAAATAEAWCCAKGDHTAEAFNRCYRKALDAA